MSAKNHRKTISITINDRIEELLSDIMLHKGIDSRSAAFGYTVAECHSSLFPAYLANRSPVSIKGPKTIEEKAADQAKLKLARKNAEVSQLREAKRSLCEIDFEGRVVEREGDGELMCEWENYDMRNSYTQRLPLVQMHKDYLPARFRPTKELVYKNNPLFKGKKMPK